MFWRGSTSRRIPATKRDEEVTLVRGAPLFPPRLVHNRGLHLSRSTPHDPTQQPRHPLRTEPRIPRLSDAVPSSPPPSCSGGRKSRSDGGPKSTPRGFCLVGGEPLHSRACPRSRISIALSAIDVGLNPQPPTLGEPTRLRPHKALAGPTRCDPRARGKGTDPAASLDALPTSDEAPSTAPPRATAPGHQTQVCTVHPLTSDFCRHRQRAVGWRRRRFVRTHGPSARHTLVHLDPSIVWDARGSLAIRSTAPPSLTDFAFRARRFGAATRELAGWVTPPTPWRSGPRLLT